MSINVVLTSKYLLVWGATYAIKEQIQDLGGRWSPTEGLWKLSPLLDSVTISTMLNAELDIAKARAIALAKAQALGKN
jgi:hypothetical protein